MDGQTAPAEPEFGTLKPRRALRTALLLTRHIPGVWPGKTVTSIIKDLVWSSVGDAVDVDVFHCRMRLYPHDNLCEKRVLFTPQFFDPAERRFLRERVRPGFTFVDIGANVGAYSLYVGRLCGGKARIVAVEPDPVIYSRLRYNVQANDLEMIVTVQAAVSDETGFVELFLNGHNRGQNSLVVGAGSALLVPAVTLVELFDAHGIARPDCLKIDIEGAEDRVFGRFLNDAPVDRYPRTIILEQIRNRDLSPAAELLLRRGYRILQRTRMNLILEH
jgi:FkbM family methyltransferase